MHRDDAAVMQLSETRRQLSTLRWADMPNGFDNQNCGLIHGSPIVPSWGTK